MNAGITGDGINEHPPMEHPPMEHPPMEHPPMTWQRILHIGVLGRFLPRPRLFFLGEFCA